MFAAPDTNHVPDWVMKSIVPHSPEPVLNWPTARNGYCWNTLDILKQNVEQARNEAHRRCRIGRIILKAACPSSPSPKP